MAEQDDVLHLIDDTETAREDSSARKWKIAVIDDDAAVHEGTRFALSDYSLNGATLEILSAYSAAEGRTLMREHPDIAAVLLDVIMETDVAGLELVEYIRNEIKNETVRIILRTGQPGQAPERRVIVDYDINDYKAKTELTADKLFTALTAALRSHQQLERMVQTRRGLEIIIEAASALFDFKSMQGWRRGSSPRSHRCSTSTAREFWCCVKVRTRTRRSRCSLDRAATAASSAARSPRSSSTTCDTWSRRHSPAAITSSRRADRCSTSRR